MDVPFLETNDCDEVIQSECEITNLSETYSSSPPVPLSATSSGSTSLQFKEDDTTGVTSASTDSTECRTSTTTTEGLGRWDTPEQVSSPAFDLSGLNTSLAPLHCDFDDPDSDKSDLSPGSRKLIEPDVGSINKLLNFDNESDDSCDDLLDDGSDSSDNLNDDSHSPEDISGGNLTLNTTSDMSQAVYQPNMAQMHTSLEEELKSSWSQPSSSLAMANLSLEEVGHIRSVHARAEIESLPDDCTTKRDVIEGKICFQCVKTKFGLFCKSRKCPLCTQAVCSKCVAKISATPFLLMPVKNKVVSASGTPLPRQRSTTTTLPRQWSTTGTSLHHSTGSLKRSSGSMSSNQGSVLSVCLDCREMVVQIIRSGETYRKVQEARSVMLSSLARRERGSGEV